MNVSLTSNNDIGILNKKNKLPVKGSEIREEYQQS